jgi:hypothetical protein
VHDLDEPWLTPVLPTPGDNMVGLWDGRGLTFLSAVTMTTSGSLPLPHPDEPPSAALLIPSPWARGVRFAALVHDGREWWVLDPDGASSLPTGLYWRPALPEASTLRSVPVSWAWHGPEHLELAGLGAGGALHWSALVGEGRLDLVARNVSAPGGGYLAAAVVRPGLVAGVTRSHVAWLRGGADAFTAMRPTEVAIPSAVACFASPRTRELIVVCSDGFIARVPIP